MAVWACHYATTASGTTAAWQCSAKQCNATATGSARVPVALPVPVALIRLQLVPVGRGITASPISMMLLLLVLLAPAASHALSLRPNETHLFLDLDGIAAIENITVALGALTKNYASPAVVPEHPWEELLHFYTSALAVPAGAAGAGSAAEFRLYYSCFVPSGPMYLCVATSADGGTWFKPLLSAFPFNGSATNRVFLVNQSSPGSWPGSVFLDARAGVPAAERFKLTYEGAGMERLLYLATSPDGLQWAKRVPEAPILDTRLFSDTQTAMVWDAAGGRYLVFGRADAQEPGNTSVGCYGAYPSLRRVMLAVSNVSAEGPFSAPVQVLGPGAPDAPSCLDIYNPAPIAVPGALLLLPASYLHYPAAAAVPPPAPGATANDGLLDVRLAASRNGAAFALVSRDVFLERGIGYRLPAAAGGAFAAAGSDADAGFVFACAGGLVDGEALLDPAAATQRTPTAPFPFYVPPPRQGLLYFGAQRTHGGSASAPSAGFQGVLTASLRREGWAGLRSPPGDPAGAGAFTTLPLTVPRAADACGAPGAQLWLLLNAATSVAGSVGLALLDGATLAPLANFSTPCVFTGNAVRWPAAWATAGNPAQPCTRDISSLAGSSVAARVALRHAHLFAWELQCVAAGASL